MTPPPSPLSTGEIGHRPTIKLIENPIFGRISMNYTFLPCFFFEIPSLSGRKTAFKYRKSWEFCQKVSILIRCYARYFIQAKTLVLFRRMLQKPVQNDKIPGTPMFSRVLPIGHRKPQIYHQVNHKGSRSSMERGVSGSGGRRENV